MTELEGVLRPNREEVAAEVLDGEAILINLTSGVYYSMDGVGGVVWSLIEQGAGISTIVDRVSDTFGVARDQVETDLRNLVAELIRENLVAHSESSEASSSDLTMPEGRPAEYESPKLLTYRDMGELLALDPPAPGLTDIRWTERKDDQKS